MGLRSRRSDRDGVFSGNEPDRAIIDIGSNTVRMVLYGGSLRAPMTLFNEKVTARLGRDIATRGELAPEAIELAMRALRRYALLLNDLGVTDIECVATAAAREASNGPAFLDEIRAIGLDPQLLSGTEEARISAMGVLGAFPGAQGIVADVGGGSLELVVIGEGETGRSVSLPLGTLRLSQLRASNHGDLAKAIDTMLDDAGWSAKDQKQERRPLYLVGGTWRSMAVYAMQARDYPLTDPHGFSLSYDDAKALAKTMTDSEPDDLSDMARITSMRASSLPDAGVLLTCLLQRLRPSQIVFSSWGLREGVLFDRLEPYARMQDPLLAGIAVFGDMRGAPPTMATRVAGWYAGAVPAGRYGSERLRLVATTLALASMQIEPNLRVPHAIEWALAKRWIGIEAHDRGMLAAAIAANANEYDLPDGVRSLASEEALEQAVCWGLAVRLCRRLGGRSRRSLDNSELRRDGDHLVLSLEESHADLYGASNKKDLRLLADRLDLTWEVEIVGENMPSVAT